MKKNLTEIVFILDKSGSMSGLESDTIGGYNSFLEKQKKEEGEAYVSTVLFSDTSSVIYDRVSIQKIEPMNDKQYSVGGCTALLDAIGGANIDAIGEAGKLGIASSRAVRYECDGTGIMLNFDCVSESISLLRTCGAMPDNWKERIEKYHSKKNKKRSV